MNIPSYKYPVGTKVLIIEAIERAQSKCEHCKSWINFKPTYQTREVLIDQINAYIYKNSSSITYNLVDLNGFTLIRHGVKEEEIFSTAEEANIRIKELEAEWETLHSS